MKKLPLIFSLLAVTALVSINLSAKAYEVNFDPDPPLICYTTYSPQGVTTFVDCYDCEQKQGSELRDQSECEP